MGDFNVNTSSGVIETGLSDFNKRIVTVTKTAYQKLDPKITHYRDYNILQ